MENLILSFQSSDGSTNKFDAINYDSAFRQLLTFVGNANTSYKFKHGKYGKGIYYDDDCVFAYGDDLCENIAGLRNIKIYESEGNLADYFDDYDEEEEEEIEDEDYENQ